jgi:alkaline phosphatase D
VFAQRRAAAYQAYWEYMPMRRAVRCTLTRKQYLAEFRTLPYVSTPGAPAQTKAAFVLEDGQPGLQPA